MPPPAADIEVDPPLVRRLLEEQHPDLARLPLKVVANGWDNVVARLGDDLAVRVPRRFAAARLVEHEQAVLPALAAVLPVAVPAPVRVGVPSAAFPWSWSVLPWFEGRTVAAGRASGTIATGLAAFVRALHVPAPPSAPANPMRGVPLADRAVDVVARLDALGPGARTAALRRVWADALAAPLWAGPPVWLHGDLHPANLIERDGALVAVIDFGDVTAGDPATDLATAWLTFDAAERAVFQGLVPVGPADWARARGWALVMGAAMALMSEPGTVTARLGEAALERVAAEA